jgi:hypothetical protein
LVIPGNDPRILVYSLGYLKQQPKSKINMKFITIITTIAILAVVAVPFHEVSETASKDYSTAILQESEEKYDTPANEQPIDEDTETTYNPTDDKQDTEGTTDDKTYSTQGTDSTTDDNTYEGTEGTIDSNTKKGAKDADVVIYKDEKPATQTSGSIIIAASIIGVAAFFWL